MSGHGSNRFRRALLGGVTNGKNQVIHKIREAGHERVPESPEMCTIVHFLSKDVSGIELPGHMLDVGSVVLDPLAN